MSETLDVDLYEYGYAKMPEPWDTHTVTFATDRTTRERFVSVGFICEVVGLDVDTQTRTLRKAIEALLDESDGAAFALDPRALRKISLPPRADAAPRSGWRSHVCILYTEVGWWLAHISPHRIKNMSTRHHVDMFQRALKVAADRLLWRNGVALPRQTPLIARLSSTSSSCSHEVACPYCLHWLKVEAHDGEQSVKEID